MLLERRPAFLKRLLVSLFLLPLGLHLAVAGGALGLSALGPPGRDPATDVPGWVAILLLGCGVSFALGA